MVQPGVTSDIECGTERAALGLPATENDPIHPRVDRRSDTHQTRLDRDVEARADQAIVSDRRRGGTHRVHLRVRRGILRGDRRIVSATHDAARVAHDSADGDLAHCRGSARQIERDSHERDVCVFFVANHVPSPARSIASATIRWLPVAVDANYDRPTMSQSNIDIDIDSEIIAMGVAGRHRVIARTGTTLTIMSAAGVSKTVHESAVRLAPAAPEPAATKT